MTMNEQLARARSVVANLPPLAGRPRVSYDDLVAVLCEPSAMFGAPSAVRATARPDRPSLDGDWLAEILNQIVAFRGIPCTTMMETVQMAAEMVRRRGIAICDGPAVDVWVLDEGTDDVQMRYILRLDAPHHVAAELDDALTWWLCELEMCRPGFTFSFSGAWTDEDLRRLRERAEELVQTTRGDTHADLPS